MAKTTGQALVLKNKVKVSFDCKMFGVTDGVACINREHGPRGSPSHKTLSVTPQGELEISSVTKQPSSLVGDHIISPGLVAISPQHAKGFRPSPKDHNIQIFTDASNAGPGTHVDELDQE